MDTELEKIIRTWEKMRGEPTIGKNMKVIIEATLVKLYERRLRKG